MLEIIRKGKKSVGFVLIVGFIAVLMVGFGVDYSNKQPHLTPVIRINKHEVSRQEFYYRQQQVAQTYREQFGPNFDQIRGMLRLEQQTVDRIIRERLLSDFIESLGLTASKSQVEERIKSHPFFAQNPLNEQNFRFFLQQLGLTSRGLEQETIKAIAAEQLENMISDLNIPTEAEIRSAFQRENTKLEFAYLAFRPSDFEKSIDVLDDEKLREYFLANADRYRTTRKIKYDYVTFDPKDHLAKVQIDPQDIEEMYETRIMEFSEPAQFKLREIVLRKPGKSGSAVEELISGKADTDSEAENAKRKEAAEILELLKAGADFSELARQRSENKKTGSLGGERDWVKSTDLLRSAQKALEKLVEGEFTEVLETEDSFVIYLVEGIKDPKPRPIDEVRAQLETELRAAFAPEYARLAAEDFLQRWEQSRSDSDGTLLGFAQQQGLHPSSTTDFVSASEDPKDPAAAGLSAKAITIAKGAYDIIRLGNLEFLVQVKDEQEASIPEFSTVRPTVVADYIAERSKELARIAAETALQQLRQKNETSEDDTIAKKSLQQIAAEHSLEVQSTEPVSRTSSSQSEFLSAPDVRTTAFTLTKENPYPQSVSQGIDGTLYVYQLLSETKPSDEEYRQARASLLEKEQEKIKSRTGAFIVEGLKAAADVWVDPSILIGVQGLDSFDL